MGGFFESRVVVWLACVVSGCDVVVGASRVRVGWSCSVLGKASYHVPKIMHRGPGPHMMEPNLICLQSTAEETAGDTGRQRLDREREGGTGTHLPLVGVYPRPRWDAVAWMSAATET